MLSDVRTAEIKKALSGAIIAGRLLDRLLDKRTELYSKAIYSSPKYSHTAKFKGRPDRMAEALVKLGNIDRKIAEATEEYCGQLERIKDLIKLLGADFDARIVLEYRYLNGSEWPDIAAALGLSLQHVFLLHKRGVEKLANMTEPTAPDP